MGDDNKPVDPDATQFIPSPGRKKADLGQATMAAMEQAVLRGPQLDLDAMSGVNPLVAAANPILAMVPRIRVAVSHPDPGRLRDSLLEQIARYEQLARSRGVAAEDVMIGRYALCTLVDEAVSATPWGGTAQWANRSLLVTLHQETWGGEKFFQVLNRLAEMPAAKIDLIELFYVCLAMGLEGRFRILDNGKAQLDALREKVVAVIRSVRGEYDRDLSPNWRGVRSEFGRVRTLFPLWASIAGAAFVLLAGYAALSFSLNMTSDDVAYGKLRVAMPKPPVPVAPAPVTPRLSRFLEAEIREHLVEVHEDARQSVVTILGDGLFDSGSATVKARYEPVLDRIAEALNSVPGLVMVTGHTDDRPSRSIRFPSNWHLSKDRAENVMKMLQNKVADRSRLHAEGRGENEPVAPNDSDANRAKNRRVDIILQVAG